MRPFFAAALFGPGREDYWRRCLEEAATPDRVAPANARRHEVTAEIAELERRLDRQVCGLESDEVTPMLRRRVAARIAEPEEAIAERHTRLAALEAETQAGPVSFAAVAPLLDRLPILASSLDTGPQGELRELFDSLQLDVVYRPADSALDVAVTLYDDGSETAQSAAQVRAEDWSVPPAGFEPAPPAPEAGALSPELRGPVVHEASPTSRSARIPRLRALRHGASAPDRLAC